MISAMTTSLNAEILSFPSFQIEIQDGWEHSIESLPGNDSRSMISLRHPDGVGILKIGSYDALAVVSEDILRNMTNLDSSIPLTWQNWGDYSGYQYDYLERGSFYRQWWLAGSRDPLPKERSPHHPIVRRQSPPPDIHPIESVRRPPRPRGRSATRSPDRRPGYKS